MRLIAGQSSVDEAHHDVVLEPLVNLDVPSVDKRAEISASIHRVNIDASYRVEVFRLLALISRSLLGWFVPLAASNKAALHRCEAKDEGDLFDGACADKVPSFGEHGPL